MAYVESFNKSVFIVSVDSLVKLSSHYKLSVLVPWVSGGATLYIYIF